MKLKVWYNNDGFGAITSQEVETSRSIADVSAALNTDKTFVLLGTIWFPRHSIQRVEILSGN